MKKNIYQKPRVSKNKLTVRLYNGRNRYLDMKNPVYLVKEPEC